MRCAGLALIAIAVAGCATRSYEPAVLYTLRVEPSVNPCERSDKTVMIRPLDHARPYTQQIAYREGLELGHYTTVEWAETPDSIVTRALQDALVASGRYADVGIAPDVTKPDYILTGQVRQFDVVRDSEPWTAVCEVRVELRAALDRAVVWAGTQRASVPLGANEVTALPEAMGRAVSSVIAESVAGMTRE